MDSLAERVLARYADLWRGRLESFRRSGFSGARVWKVHAPAGLLCLRAGQAGESRSLVVRRQTLMRLAVEGGLSFVPALIPLPDGGAAVEADGRHWELMRWMPGTASYHSEPSPARLRAAVRAVASVHRAWCHEPVRVRGCPAIERRLEAAKVAVEGRYTGGLQQLQALLVVHLPRAVRELHALGRMWRLQWCLRDVWHDHLLFEGEVLRGLVDYGAVGPDTVAVDLARMLGSLLEDDEAGWTDGLRAYREVAPLSDAEAELARCLDRTGVIASLAKWFRRLSESKTERLTEQVEERLEQLMRRVERWG